MLTIKSQDSADEEKLHELFGMDAEDEMQTKIETHSGYWLNNGDNKWDYHHYVNEIEAAEIITAARDLVMSLTEEQAHSLTSQSMTEDEMGNTLVKFIDLAQAVQDGLI